MNDIIKIIMSDTNSNLVRVFNFRKVFKANIISMKCLVFGEEYKDKRVSNWDNEIRRKNVCIVVLKDLVISHKKPFPSPESSTMAVFHAFSSHLVNTHGCMKTFPGTYVVSFHHDTEEEMKMTENFIERLKGNSVENFSIEPQNVNFIPFPSIKTYCNAVVNVHDFGYDLYCMRHKFYYDSHTQRALHMKVVNLLIQYEEEQNNDDSTHWIVVSKDQLSKFRNLEDARCYISEIFQLNYCYLYSVDFDDGIIVDKNNVEDKFVNPHPDSELYDDMCKVSLDELQNPDEHIKEESNEDETNEENPEDETVEEKEENTEIEEDEESVPTTENSVDLSEDELLGNLDSDTDEVLEHADCDEYHINTILEPLVAEMEEKIQNREYAKAIRMYEQTNEMLNSMCDAMEDGKCNELYETAKEQLENCDNDSTIAEHDEDIQNVHVLHPHTCNACSYAVKAVMIGLIVEYVVVVGACLYLRYWGY